MAATAPDTAPADDPEADVGLPPRRWSSWTDRATWTAWADHHRDDLVVAAIFTAARIIVIAVCGVRMDLGFLTFAPQVPDTGALRHHLLQTLLYEHTEPPVFNTLVGVLLKFSPFPDGITFQVAYLVMGLALALVVFRLARMVGLGRLAAFGAIALLVTNPGMLAIEFNASYDLPTALLLALTLLAIGHYVTSGSLRHLTWAAVGAASVVLTRTIFHPAWYLLVVAGLLLMRAPAADRRRVTVALVLPALVIGLCILKNEVIYGEATLSTFSGASIDKIAGAVATPAEKQQMIADGTVSKLFGRDVFYGYYVYRDAMPPCHPKHADIPILADELRPDNNSPNLNYECFLAVYQQQSADGQAYVKAHPVRFLGGELAGTQFFFEPPMGIVFTRNTHALRGIQSVYDWTLYPKVQLRPITHNRFSDARQAVLGGIELQPTVVLLDLGVIILGLSTIRRLIRGRSKSGGGARRTAMALWAAMALACLWVTTIGSAFEINENARYRLLIEPYLLILLALVIERAVTLARARLAGPRAEPA